MYMESRDPGGLWLASCTVVDHAISPPSALQLSTPLRFLHPLSSDGHLHCFFLSGTQSVGITACGQDFFGDLFSVLEPCSYT